MTNSRKRWVAVLVTSGVLGLGALIAAGPAAAAVGAFGHPSVAGSPGPGGGAGRGAGNGMGAGNGYGMGVGNGVGLRDGSCLTASPAPSGTLTATQKQTLAAMAEEEKLAGDLYQAFADAYPAAVFDRIASAEDQHLSAVRTLLTRYGVSDPTAGRAAGQFATASVQATYDRLLAQGKAGQSAALGVGKQVEQTDIAALEKALTGLSAPDVTQVYQHLLAASRQHLSAFTNWAAR